MELLKKYPAVCESFNPRITPLEWYFTFLLFLYGKLLFKSLF
jgi:hypothetical protein